MPRQRNRGSQQFGKSKNSFRSNSDSFIDNKEHFDRGRTDIVEGFQSTSTRTGKTEGNVGNTGTGIKKSRYAIAAQTYSSEKSNYEQELSGKDMVSAPPPTNQPMLESVTQNAVRQGLEDIIDDSTEGTEMRGLQGPGGAIQNPEAEHFTSLVNCKHDDNTYDSTLGGVGNQRRTLDPIVCKSRNINLINSFNLNVKGNNAGELSSKISCIMKQVCNATAIANLSTNGDGPDNQANVEKRNKDIKSFDDCENNRSSNEQSTFLINLKTAIDAMTAPITDKIKETRSEMTLAPTPKQNVSSAIKSQTQRPKQKMKCTIRQLTTKPTPSANVKGPIEGMTNKPTDKMKCTTRQLTKPMETKLNPKGFSQHQVYNKKCAKITLRNIMKPVDTLVNPVGDTGMTERPNDCPAKTLRELSENNMHQFINLNTTVKNGTNNDKQEPYISKHKCNNPTDTQVNAATQVPSTMSRDSEVTSNRLADILCQLAGFDENRTNGEGAKVNNGPEDINVAIKKMTCKSYGDFQTVGSLVPNNSVDLNYDNINPKKACTKDISDTFLLIPYKYNDTIKPEDTNQYCSNYQ